MHLSTCKYILQIWSVLDNIKNAGEIMLGEFFQYIANFSLGPNNVIPTNAWAKTKSPLSVHDFIKSTQ